MTGLPRGSKKGQLSTKAAILVVAVAGMSAVFVSVPSDAASSEGTEPNHALVDKIVVASDRHAPTFPPTDLEIYLLDLDGSGAQQLTDNAGAASAFGSLSPDGKKIVFDSNRNRLEGEPLNTSGLFLMNADGSDQTFLTRGGSPSWSPDGRYIAFHASASGTGRPINNNPGAATEDSDIFIVNVDDLLEHGTPPKNLTNDPTSVDDDPDWSPDGNSIVYTSHDVNQRPVPPAPLDYTTAEIYVRAADGTSTPTRLTTNSEEERAPNWSHQGDRISYMCHAGSVRFAICVMNADGTVQTKLTTDPRAALSSAWSPDDQRIFFNRPTLGLDGRTANRLWWVAADGTAEQILVALESEPSFTTLFPDVGVLRVKPD